MGDEILAAYSKAEGHLAVLIATATRALNAVRALNANVSDRQALDTLEQANALLTDDALGAVRAVDEFTPIVEAMARPIEF